MFQEVIVIKTYKVKQDSKPEDFNVDDKEFIGSIYVSWKECPQTESDDGSSKILQFTTELSDPDDSSINSISGAISGSVKWVKFGPKGSKYNAAGVKQAAPKA